jgi:hypothetical protein
MSIELDRRKCFTEKRMGPGTHTSYKARLQKFNLRIVGSFIKKKKKQISTKRHNFEVRKSGLGLMGED